MVAARWLVDKKILARRDDIFWLTFEEILEALRSADQPNLMPIVDQRQEQHMLWAKMTPPPLLGLPDPSLPKRPPFGDEVTSQSGQDEPSIIRGQAAAPGVAAGRARVVKNEIDLPDFKPGDILVAGNIGPRWTPIFPLLGGIVLDTGSVGQHAAVTAREYGLVAVIATGDATKRIPDQSQITIDGTMGTVRIGEGS